MLHARCNGPTCLPPDCNFDPMYFRMAMTASTEPFGYDKQWWTLKLPNPIVLASPIRNNGITEFQPIRNLFLGLRVHLRGLAVTDTPLEGQATQATKNYLKTRVWHSLTHHRILQHPPTWIIFWADITYCMIWYKSLPSPKSCFSKSYILQNYTGQETPSSVGVGNHKRYRQR